MVIEGQQTKRREDKVAKQNLASMSVDALLKLRDDIAERPMP